MLDCSFISKYETTASSGLWDTFSEKKNTFSAIKMTASLIFELIYVEEYRSRLIKKKKKELSIKIVYSYGEEIIVTRTCIDHRSVQDRIVRRFSHSVSRIEEMKIDAANLRTRDGIKGINLVDFFLKLRLHPDICTISIFSRGKR